MASPKAINCRLGVADSDIQEDLSKHSDKTARVKEIYRLGLLYEAMERDNTLIPDKLTATCYRVFLQDSRKKSPDLSTLYNS